ncbi:MAG: formylglycine-generating enzyme family protein [Pontiellaceae bacterium]|jgi:formylglycine-generating enzyme required for sulfatase activity|nr:formylglycine-generating enzyme family protein [Pontiellaceae bacterium]
MKTQFIRVLKFFAAVVALSLPLCGSAQDAAFFRIVSPTNSEITAFSPGDGTVVWTNGATGVTCTVQRAVTLVGPSNWVDYVQHNVTNTSMTARLMDLNPPEGMVYIPAGVNSGANPLAAGESYDPSWYPATYSLTNASPFYMDRTEVTKAQWDTVYNWAITNGYIFDNAGSGKASTHPVHTVSWYDCVKWCNARSQMEGRTPCYNLSDWICNFSANGYRLPTNVEWEYAVRGGLSGKRFPWGDTITHSQANYYSSNGYAYDISPTRNYHPSYATGDFPYTSPAGSFSANGYGLYDMAGNVWEWCNTASGSYRYYRGGSWCYSAYLARCGYAFWIDPDSARYYFGFRSVCR